MFTRKMTLLSSNMAEVPMLFLGFCLVDGETARWLERGFTDWKGRGSNPTSASRLPLLRLGQPSSIPALELIERNQCVELGFHGLTRLLMDATLRPQPGDPVHSRLCHHPRIATPQFLHTRLGQKLNGLVTLIECERLRCSRFQNVALRSLDSCSVATDFVGVLGHVTTASADLVACLVEPNIERLCDPPGTAGLSQFSISWL
ncbi:hypothetical protein T265_13320, partial [Opisthorchis viverrini]